MNKLVVVSLLVVAFAGCVSDDAATTPVEDEVPVGSIPVAKRPVLDRPVTDYLHDLSPILDGVSVQTATMVHLRTAVDELIELDTWIAVPNVEGPVPTVLEVTPYYAGGNPQPATVIEPSTGEAIPFSRVANELVQRGYAVGVSSVRGTGNSGGCFTQGGPQEAEDTAAVIEHVAGQPWSNGNIGMMGVSYPGTTPNDAWVEAPPALKAVVPISGISDLYKYNFVNGVPINVQGFGFNTYYWALTGAVPFPLGVSGLGPVTDPANMVTAGAGEACADQADVQQGGVTSTVDGNKDAYWQVRDFHAEYMAEPDKHRPAVFFIHGLQDWNVKPHNMEDWLPALQASGSDYKVWLGQWGHAWPQGGDCEYNVEQDRGANCRNDWWTQVLVAWFDQFLLDRDTGILDAPRVQVQDDDGRWRHEQAWPPADTEPLRLHLAPGKLQAEPGSGSVTYFDARGGLPTLPVDSGATEAVFVSEPFAENVTISGLPVFHGNVTASGHRASLILSLQEELPNGVRRSFNFCAQSLNHVDSLAAGAVSIAGTTQEVEVACFPQDDVVHAGSKLVLVASGNTIGGPGPALQPVSDGSDITLDLAGAWLELPIDPVTIYEDPQPYA